MSRDSLDTGPRIALDGRPAADLVGISGYATVAACVLAIDGLPPAIRVPIALPLLAFVPGYALVAALLPTSRTAPTPATEGNGRDAGYTRGQNAGLSVLERATLGSIASVAIVPMVALAADAVGDLTLVPVLAGLVVVTLGASAVGLSRRPERPRADPLAPDDSGPTDSVPGRRLAAVIPRDRVTLAAVVVAALLLTTSAAIALSGGAGSGDGVDAGGGVATEFYLLNDTEDGRFPGDGAYPRTLERGTAHSFTLGIEHQADGPCTYTIVAVLEWVDRSGNGTRVVSFDELARETTTVPAGSPRIRNYSVVPQTAGTDLRATFFLYRGDAPTTPARDSAHRVLRFPVTVTPNSD